MVNRVRQLIEHLGGGAKQAPSFPEPKLDPAVVEALLVRARIWVARGPLCSEQRALLDDLDAVSREAHDLVERRGFGPAAPYHGRYKGLPEWWRDEYRNDPLLGAIASHGVPAGIALHRVIAAYWSVRQIMILRTELTTDPFRVEPKVPAAKQEEGDGRGEPG